MTPERPNTLPKEERLHGKTGITALMEKGHWCTEGHLKYCYKAGNDCSREGEPYCRIIASVPKKIFKRAVKRNLLKRRIRESYRTRKGILYGKDMDILFVYSSSEIATSEQLGSEMEAILNTLATK